MYKFSDFDTVKELPNAVKISELGEAIGLSLTRTYEFVEDMKIPCFYVGQRKILFKEHILQNFDTYMSYTELSQLKAIRGLPRVFNPKYLIFALRISHGLAYDIAKFVGFPAVHTRNRIVINKQDFIGQFLPRI